jgi:hypothetical protein
LSLSFSEYSKDTAQNFLQSVLFVDDKAYCANQSDHPFDVKMMIKESADRGLIASAYSPEQLSDLDAIAKIGKKVDVLVLDWRIDIKDDTEKVNSDDEEEEDTADRRGEFAIQVIKKIISNDDGDKATDQLKLIFIYTGENGLQEIRSELSKQLSQFQSDDAYTLFKGGIRISIWAKESLTHAFKHVPENRSRLRSYNELIDEITTEYIKVSSGLMSNTCLNALTCIRNNTHKLLAKFSPELDPAFVAHRAMLPRPEDADELLKEIICEEIKSILTNEDVGSGTNNDTISKWMELQTFENVTMTLKDKRTKTTTTIDNAKRIIWQNEGYESLLIKECDGNGNRILNDDEIEDFDRKRLRSYACKTFTPNDVSRKFLDEDFSILTHHRRNIFTATRIPTLTLGTILKSDDQYLVCIQQKCDSVRIPANEPRKFLFLPLIESENKFDILYKNESDKYISLSICYKNCHFLHIIEFTPFEYSGIVRAEKVGDKFYFTSHGKEADKYHWILDLKDAHAQRLANNFAAQLARVGLDESEWLRRA